MLGVLSPNKRHLVSIVSGIYLWREMLQKLSATGTKGIREKKIQLTVLFKTEHPGRIK